MVSQLLGISSNSTGAPVRTIQDCTGSSMLPKVAVTKFCLSRRKVIPPSSLGDHTTQTNSISCRNAAKAIGRTFLSACGVLAGVSGNRLYKAVTLWNSGQNSSLERASN